MSIDQPRQPSGRFDVTARAEASVRLARDVYVLVHPERFPSNDWEVDDEAYGASVNAAGDGVRRIAILDGCGMGDVQDDIDDGTNPDLTVGVPAAGYELNMFEPNQLRAAAKQIAASLEPGQRVAVGGFARQDCVKRTVAGLRAAGVDAFLDDPTTLPYV